MPLVKIVGGQLIVEPPEGPNIKLILDFFTFCITEEGMPNEVISGLTFEIYFSKIILWSLISSFLFQGTLLNVSHGNTL